MCARTSWYWNWIHICTSTDSQTLDRKYISMLVHDEHHSCTLHVVIMQFRILVNELLVLFSVVVASILHATETHVNEFTAKNKSACVIHSFMIRISIRDTFAKHQPPILAWIVIDTRCEYKRFSYFGCFVRWSLSLSIQRMREIARVCARISKKDDRSGCVAGVVIDTATPHVVVKFFKWMV